MKKGLLTSLVLLFSFFVVGAFAQTTVSGTVTDENGEALPGITILVEGTSKGTATALDGSFSINNVPDGASLIFKGVGYASQIIPVQGSTIDLTLLEDTKQLNAVVVDAAGFERNRDEIGVSSSTVTGTALVDSGEPQLLNSLNGKAAGINLTQNSGDPGAGSRIVIRGATSITGDLDPLFIIDGVPMYNDANYGNDIDGTGSNYLGSGGGVAASNRLNDLNPNDIESIEVLKGASAAALWGARAANGVVIITTKKGSVSKGKNFTVDVSFSYAIDQINQLPELQDRFGQGNSGSYQFVPAGGRSWGDVIANRAGGADVFDTSGERFEGSDGRVYYPITTKNSRETFDTYDAIFDLGSTITTNVSVGSASEKGSMYASFSDMQQEGIIRNNSDYRRTTARYNVTRYLGDKFTLNVNSAYTKSTTNLVQQGSNLSGLFLGGMRTPADYDVSTYTGTYIAADGTQFANRQKAYRNPLGANANSIYDNPLWTIENVATSSEVNRFIGSVELSYDPLSWLNLTARGGTDIYSDVQRSSFPVLASGANQGGRFDETNYTGTQFNMDLIARGRFNLSSDIQLTTLLGFGMNERERTASTTQTRSFVNSIAPPNLVNASTFFPNSRITSIRNMGTYATIGLDLYDQVFINFGGRLEAWSSLPENNNTFFYPSVDLAWQFSQLIPENDIFTFGKLRFGYGQVGRAPDPYLTTQDFIIAGPTDVGFSEGWGGAFNSTEYGGIVLQDNSAANQDLKPEIKTEFEIGLDTRFWNDRISASFTYYNNTTKDLQIALPLPETTGFTSVSSNVAEVTNEGYEFELSGEVLRLDNGLSLTLRGNYSRNINEVTSLAGADNILLGGFTDGGSYAVEGAQLGVIFGSRWARNDDGSLALNENGFPTQAATEGIIGDPNPDYRIGWGGTLSWKGLSLNFLFDGSYGGDMWNGTRGALYFFGRHDDQSNIVNLSAAEAASLPTHNARGVITDVATAYAGTGYQQADGSFQVRGEIKNFGGGNVFIGEYSHRVGPFSGFTGPSEQYVEDASWTRLRELSLGYTWNTQGFQDATGLSALSFTFTGRNLILWTDYSGIDPDTNLGGAGFNALGLDYFNNPATRSYIFTLKLTY